MDQFVDIKRLLLLVILWASPGCRGQRGKSGVSLIVNWNVWAPVRETG